MSVATHCRAHKRTCYNHLVRMTGLNIMVREIQATEAKARLAELLRNVEHGETIAITRHEETVKTISHLTEGD